jgi:ribosome maturation factor RimP
MELQTEIRQLAESLLGNPAHFIVEVTVSIKRKPGKIVVALDGDEGISIEDCAELSRKLSEALDQTSLVDENYTLEVSTPGLDQPLKLTRQYRKNIGRMLKVKVAEETRAIEGKLVSVNDTGLVLSQKSGKGKKAEEKETSIPFSTIEKAFVTISFN